MNIYKDLEDSLYNVVSKLFPEVEVTIAYDNGPEPLTSFICIDVDRMAPIGREYTSTPTTGGPADKLIEVTYQDMSARVVFHVVGKNDSNAQAGELAHNLQVLLRSTYGYELQAENGLALHKLVELRRIRDRRDTDTYIKYRVEAMFAFTTAVSTEVGETVGLGINGTYTDAGREPDHEILSRIEINFPTP